MADNNKHENKTEELLEKQEIQILKEYTTMSKTKEELNALKEEVETVNEKCRKFTEEELEQVTGGVALISGDDAAGISKGYKPGFLK